MKECIVCKSQNVNEVVRNKLHMFECSECNLVWRQEFDVEIDHYECKEIELGEDKLSARIRNVKDRIKFIEKYIKPNSLCDIGAGEGVFLLELKKKEYKNIIGIEPNIEAVSFAKSQGLKIYEKSIDKSSRIIKDNNIHIITLFHVIEHLADPRNVIESIYESLPYSGYVVIETPNINAYTFKKKDFQHPLVYPEHFFYFNIKNLEKLLESIGFHTKAKGKRDFDQYNMSIQESLFRLGIGKSLFKLNSVGNINAAKFHTNKIRKDSLLRILLRTILNRLVLFFGRVDYQWIIAQK